MAPGLETAKGKEAIEGKGGESVLTHFQPGDKVIIHSLISDEGKTLNGMSGVIVNFNDENGRFGVELSKISASLPRYIKAANLTMMQPASIQGQAAAADEVEVEEDPGYPEEPLLVLYKPSTLPLLLSPTAKEAKRLQKQLPLIFPWVRHSCAVSPQTMTIVDKAAFQLQWDAFSCSLFASWSSTDFENILIAGGSILACILPAPANFTRLKHSPYNNSEWCDFNFVNFDGARLEADKPPTMLTQYMQQVILFCTR